MSHNSDLITANLFALQVLVAAGLIWAGITLFDVSFIEAYIAVITCVAVLNTWRLSRLI